MNWKLKCCYLEVATEPAMDLPISKLIRPYRLAWYSSNKAVSLSLNWHWSVLQASLPVTTHLYTEKQENIPSEKIANLKQLTLYIKYTMSQNQQAWESQDRRKTYKMQLKRS